MPSILRTVLKMLREFSLKNVSNNVESCFFIENNINSLSLKTNTYILCYSLAINEHAIVFFTRQKIKQFLLLCYPLIIMSIPF
jgi:hypothetical protein